MNPVINLTGKQFGKLTVIERDPKAHRRVDWICRCECGNITSVSGTDLRNGHTRSCGCLKYDTHNATHGMKDTRIYETWCDMRKRCENPNSKSYKHYGAKGISVCDEWKADFTSFYHWAINNGYSDDLTIDRIDSSKGYDPSNCRWITRKEQNRNRSNTILVQHCGNLEPLSKLCEDLKFSYQVALKRVHFLKNQGAPLKSEDIFY